MLRFVDIMAYPATKESCTEKGYYVYNKDSEYTERGKSTFEYALNDFKPHIVFTIGDPWDHYYVPTIKQKSSFYWIAYTPIETSPIEPQVRIEVIEDLRKGFFSFTKYYERVDKIVAYNNFGKQAISSLIGSEDKLDIIEHGVDHSTFNIKTIDRSNIFGSDINDDSFMVLTVARNNHRKSLDIMLQGWSKFINLLSDSDKKRVRLYLHVPQEPGGWNLDRLASITQTYGTIMVNRAINLDNPLSETKLTEIMNGSDVYINTSRGEGFGLPIIESMACGCSALVPNYAGPACIASNINNENHIKTISVSEYMIDQKSLSYFAILSTNDIANNLMNKFTNLKEDRSRREERSLLIKEKYSWETIGKQWIALINSIDKTLLQHSRFTFTRI